MVKLLNIQVRLNAPKMRTGKNSQYRSLEDIIASVKPLLEQTGVAILMSDKVVNVGEHNYLEATASMYCIETGELISSATGVAKEGKLPVSKAGNQIITEAQASGANSTYARRYALTGLLAIDGQSDHDYCFPASPEPIHQAPASTNQAPASTNQATQTQKTPFEIATDLAKGNPKREDFMESIKGDTKKDTSSFYAQLAKKWTGA